MTYCSAPWTSLQIKTDGTFSFCCVSKDPLGDNINSDSFVDARSRILNGEILKSCQTACFDKENLFYTVRKNINKLYPIVQSNVSTTIDYENIQYLDLRLSNICNYSCLMCGSQSSHLWGKIKGFENPVVSWGDKEDSILDLINKCTNLKTVCIAGGEPFFNKQLLLKILNRLDRNVEIKFITNVSIYDESIVQVMSEFKKGKFNASIDGVEKWNDVQRNRAVWHEVENNFLKYIDTLHSGWEFNIIPTISALNFIGLYDLISWYELKIKLLRTNINFHYTILTLPEYFSPFIIPTEIRKELNNKITSNFSELSYTIKDLILATNKDVYRSTDSFFIEANNIKKMIGVDILQLLPELKAVL